MSETIDDLTIAYSEDGTETTRELGKEVLSKGAWTTIMFRYQDWDNSKKILVPSNTPLDVIKNVITNIG